jgi:hypothetical protein
MNATASYPTMIEAMNAAAAYFAAEPAAVELEYTIQLADGTLLKRFAGSDGYMLAESRYDSMGRRKKIGELRLLAAGEKVHCC